VAEVQVAEVEVHLVSREEAILAVQLTAKVREEAMDLAVSAVLVALVVLAIAVVVVVLVVQL
jgi:DUF1365 family protein